MLGTKVHKQSAWKLSLGSHLLENGSISFRVWAPFCQKVDVKVSKGRNPHFLSMSEEGDGYFYCETKKAKPGDRYVYVLNEGKERPDPVSRFQPDGVHGPSMVIHPGSFKWSDARWTGIRKKDLIFYEMHTSTFTSQGTFDAAIQKIPYLKKLGVTCLGIMPVSQFPGKRNWGYDGVGLYAVQNSYGGPHSLKKLVNACHRNGLAVYLDVVYNHLGPEGNYLRDFGPYFSSRYSTPWGEAINYDGEKAEHVRRFVVENALYWIAEYHLDALRLDAIHGIYDYSEKHILQEIGERIQSLSAQLGRKVYVIPESDLNDSRIIRMVQEGGYGLDAQWSDDFHHAVHAELTGESSGYYQDFSGVADIAKSIADGFVYDGKFSAFRQKPHGDSTKDLPGDRFVVCVQNHDQVGNRAFGDRFGTLLSLEAQKLASTLLLMSPYIPLIWMGQEYGEKAPFQYFVDHGDRGLIEAVRKGRKAEFVSFGWEDIPDPADVETWKRSKLNWHLLQKESHKKMFKLYRDLIALRKNLGFLWAIKKENVQVRYSEKENFLIVQYPDAMPRKIGILYSFSKQDRRVALPEEEKWIEILNTDDKKYGGPLRSVKNRKYQGSILLSSKCAIIASIRS